MTVELTPLGVQCNLACPYCYQHPMRDAGNIKTPTYDFEKMFAALAEEGAPFTVFGGEALLVPLPDLEKIWEWGYARYKQNGIQTNGVLITEQHVAAFKRYNVHVGFSLDGPGELNDSRWAGTTERTREQTAKSHANLALCVREGVGASVIVTLYRGNAAADRLPALMQWLRHLDAMGVRGVRIHLLEVDHPIVREKMQLSPDETLAALRQLMLLEKSLRVVSLDFLTDMRKLLRGDDDCVTCTWNACDPYTTSAVRGVDGQGNRSNCGRTNKDGVARLKAERPGYERQLALYNTPYAQGGCQGCRFFMMCKGQCPGTAIDGDWRNRSADCPTWFALFEDLEREMLAAGQVPLSVHAEREEIEQAMLELWARGHNASIRFTRDALKQGGLSRVLPVLQQGTPWHGDAHGDHTDAQRGAVPVQEHGDTPHGDSHGDHTDTSEVE